MAAVELAPAKINLFLHVIGRRADGYHLLDSLAVFAGAADHLRAEPADTLGLTIDGPFARALVGESDNLVLRAARALAEMAGIPPRAHLVLTKNLPVASGIGGGSADAAAALRALSALWDIEADLPALAARLGADVPVCIASRAARMEGVGEVLSPPPQLPPCGMMLINPGMPVATADVFRARSGVFSPPADLPAGWSDVGSMAAGLARLRNDLEEPAIGICPAIGAALNVLCSMPGCLLGRMSGSGATCFGLFPTPGQAEAAARSVRWPEWWCWGGGLHA
ncbi:MAG: 4-(cytidine 5'-diphospho)-2-C-methyl-D-erythritol kinase [Acetobacteraceae bacterium]